MTPHDFFSTILRAPDGDGGTGGAAPPAADPAAPPVGGDAGKPPADGGGITPPAGQPAPPAAAYRPEGLSDDLYGASDQETIDKLNGRLREIAEQQAASAPPEDVMAYADFSAFEASETAKPYLADLAKSPLIKPVAEKAKELGLSTAAFQQLAGAFFEAGAGQGLLEPLVDDKAERAALVPEAARNAPADKQDAAVNARLAAAEQAIDLQVANKRMPKAVADHAKLMLMDTANGVQFIEWAVAQAMGGNGMQPGGGGGGQTAEQAVNTLRAELAKPEMQPGHPKYDAAARQALSNKFKELFGSQ